MPGLITHYICANTTLSRLDRKAARVIEKNRAFYNIGAQGPDVFFYYLPGLIRKRTKGLGSVMHKGGFGALCVQLSSAIKSAPQPERDAAAAYFCGYITHYALDCAAHPYIYYRSGFRVKSRVKSLRHSVRHRNLETNIDTLVLKTMSGEKPSDKKLWHFVRLKWREGNKISKLLGDCVNSAYGRRIDERAFARAFVYMTVITRLLQSKTGRRKHLLELVEDAVIGERVVSSLIHENVADGKDYLNITKKSWRLPWDKTARRDASFAEMFEAAVIDARKMINAFFAFLSGEITIDEFSVVTGDRSFASGEEASLNLKFKYHDKGELT